MCVFGRRKSQRDSFKGWLSPIACRGCKFVKRQHNTEGNNKIMSVVVRFFSGAFPRGFGRSAFQPAVGFTGPPRAETTNMRISHSFSCGEAAARGMVGSNGIVASSKGGVARMMYDRSSGGWRFVVLQAWGVLEVKGGGRGLDIIGTSVQVTLNGGEKYP